jgi:hypothetical protein
MKRSQNTLSLRRQSIRALTRGELSMANGGAKTGTCIPTRTGLPTRTTNQTK